GLELQRGARQGARARGEAPPAPVVTALERFAVTLQQLIPDHGLESERALLRRAFAGELEETIAGAPERVRRMSRILFPGDELREDELGAAAKDAVDRRR